MAFDAVAFVSSDEIFSERERAMVDSHLYRNVLFLVMGSRKKAELLADYVRKKKARTASIILLHDTDSRYILPYLAQSIDPRAAVIDITFASPYYASAVTVLCRRPWVQISYTQWDGTPHTIFLSQPFAIDDDATGNIMASLSYGPRTLSELEKKTGLNYKTLARRTAVLLKDGCISRTDDYPIRYYVSKEQAVRYGVTASPYDAIVQGTVFRNAAEAVREYDEFILDSTDGGEDDKHPSGVYIEEGALASPGRARTRSVRSPRKDPA